MFNYDRFEELRRSKGITKKFISNALNRSPALCQDWKVGKSVPNKNQLSRVAEILGTSVAYLCCETDDPSAAETTEMDELLQTLKSREDMQMLFRLASAATPEDVRKAVKIIEVLRAEN